MTDELADVQRAKLIASRALNSGDPEDCRQALVTIELVLGAFLEKRELNVYDERKDWRAA